MNRFLWVPRDEGMARGGIDVSSHGSGSYKRFSPFSHSPTYKIPMPGNEEQRPDSVEGIWQGLKIINGRTEPSLFKGRPQKRDGKVEGHQFGDRILGYIEARERIYRPAYVYHAVNNVLPFVKKDLEGRLQNGDVVLFDVDSNGDIKDPSAPYSHAALLVDLLNMLKDAPLPPFSRRRFDDLNGELEATLEYREELAGNERKLLDETITFAYLFSPSELHRLFAVKAIEAGVGDSGRLRAVTPTVNTAEAYAAALMR